MKTNYNSFYPDSWHRHDQMEAYLDKQQDKIAEILRDTERNIDEKSYGDFIIRLKEFINEL